MSIAAVHERYVALLRNLKTTIEEAEALATSTNHGPLDAVREEADEALQALVKAFEALPDPDRDPRAHLELLATLAIETANSAHALRNVIDAVRKELN